MTRCRIWGSGAAARLPGTGPGSCHGMRLGSAAAAGAQAALAQHQTRSQIAGRPRRQQGRRPGAQLAKQLTKPCALSDVEELASHIPAVLVSAHWAHTGRAQGTAKTQGSRLWPPPSPWVSRLRC
jgi:hypothetical protein